MSELKTKVRQNMYAKRGVFDDSSSRVHELYFQYLGSSKDHQEVLLQHNCFCCSATLPGLLCNESHKNCIKGLKLAVQVAFCHAIQPH